MNQSSKTLIQTFMDLGLMYYEKNEDSSSFISFKDEETKNAIQVILKKLS